jgi:hypothetical protein
MNGHDGTPKDVRKIQNGITKQKAEKSPSLGQIKSITLRIEKRYFLGLMRGNGIIRKSVGRITQSAGRLNFKELLLGQI